jgi:ABC-type multidrug transport system ATPase subunit
VGAGKLRCEDTSKLLKLSNFHADAFFSLNVVSGRVNDSSLKVTGIITFNGNALQSGVKSAYVMQQDVLIPSLTVRETLQYSADLRLREASSKEERQKIVEEVILELSLKEAADTRVMYCSGGEKRRTSLAIQLLSNPSVLWLDEPTTGLDATSAFHLVTTLEALARKGRTIVTTIHQPRSEIWNLFDRVILLTQGSCAYSGPAAGCIPYFTSLDHPLPAFCNPAEHIIDAVAVDTRSDELEASSSARVENLKEAWKKHSHELRKDELKDSTKNVLEIVPTKEQSELVKDVPFFRQLRVLTSRTALVTVRDPMGLSGVFLEAVFMGVVTGWIFYKLDGSLAGIRSRQGAMYVACALQGYLILMFETYRVSIDIVLFDRERNEGVVSIAAFLLSRRLAKVIEDIPVPLVFSLIFYFMTGFRHDGAQFMIFFAIMVIEQYIAVCLATLCVALSRDFAIASLIGNLVYTWQTFGCGFFIAVENLPVYLKWSKWTAYVVGYGNNNFSIHILTFVVLRLWCS